MSLLRSGGGFSPAPSFLLGAVASEPSSPWNMPFGVDSPLMARPGSAGGERRQFLKAAKVAPNGSQRDLEQSSPARAGRQNRCHTPGDERGTPQG